MTVQLYVSSITKVANKPNQVNSVGHAQFTKFHDLSHFTKVMFGY